MELNTLERAILEMLLDVGSIAGDQPILRALRLQLSDLRVQEREETGVGFFTDFASSSPPDQMLAGRAFAFGDVIATHDRLAHGAGFVLFVVDGKISTLEGYSYDEGWPKEPIEFALSYLTQDRASLFAELERQFGARGEQRTSVQ